MALAGATAREIGRRLERRGVRRIFGWIRVPDPTTFGRWLRRASDCMVRS